MSHPLETAAPSPVAFDRNAAFSRTVGYVTPDELARLGQAKVAIAGLGGVGGVHLQTLARLGIGKFNIADFDRFEIHNFNRQAGAAMSTIGKTKSEVMAAIARDINPQMELQIFGEGVNPQNIDAFLEGVDVYIDGLDFFAFDARAMLFAACHAKGIPAVTVGPLGMGAALMNFVPGGMSFEEYFQWEGRSEYDKSLHMLIGLAPKASHRHYLVWPDAVNLRNRKGPSTPMACSMCAGVAATEALKHILKRGRVLAAPHSLVFDAYLNRYVRSWTPWGLRNPLMKLRLAIVRAVIAKIERAKS